MQKPYLHSGGANKVLLSKRNQIIFIRCKQYALKINCYTK